MWVTEKWPLQLSCCWACSAMGGASEMGRQGLQRLVLSLHILRLYGEPHLWCAHWDYGEEGLCLHLRNRAWGQQEVMPVWLHQFPHRATLGVDSGHGSSSYVLGQYKPKSLKDKFRGALLAKRVCSEQGGWNNMKLVVWINLMTLRTFYKWGSGADLERSSQSLWK